MDEALSDASIERFLERGFVVVPEVLTREELTFLRHESDQLFTALDADRTQATKKIVEQVTLVHNCWWVLSRIGADCNVCCVKGCVLDTMAECPVRTVATGDGDGLSELDDVDMV